MHFFYVLFEGVTWSIASKLTFDTHKYRSTLNRKFNTWVDRGIISDTYDVLTSSYLEENNIDELHIDSTDIQNKLMPKKYTYKSFKLSKQAIRVTIVGDVNKTPLDYTINSAHKPDSVLGYKLLAKSKLKFKRNTKLYGDKGYYMNKDKKDIIYQRSRLKIVVPKKKYKKKKYKTKNYKPQIKRVRHSKQMKEGLKRRIVIEHLNSVIHRSFKRIDKVHEKKKTTFEAFLQMAMSVILINKLN